MLHPGIQIDLIRQTQFFEDGLGFMSFLGREDRVGLSGGDGEGTFHVLEFGGVNEGWMGGVAGVDLTGVGAEVADDVFAAEAVADGAEFLLMSPSVFTSSFDLGLTRLVSFSCPCRALCTGR